MYLIKNLKYSDMKAMNYTEFRKDMKKNMDLANDGDEIIITRPGGKNVVLISLDEYNSLRETDHLLSTEANAKRLQKSIKNAQNGKTRKFNLNEI